jgi:hypothetical protein
MTSTDTAKQVHCQRPGCRGLLRNPESIARGTSKACDKAIQAQRAELAERAKEGFKPEQVAKAEAAVADGEVSRIAPGLYAIKSSRSAERHATDGLSCSCPAGAHDRRCWHLLAARLYEIATTIPRPVRPLALAA